MSERDGRTAAHTGVRAGWQAGRLAGCARHAIGAIGRSSSPAKELASSYEP